MNISEFRNKYPQFNNLDDNQLADKFYTKYYSEKMPKEEFYKKIGLNKVDNSEQADQKLQRVANLNKLFGIDKNIGKDIGLGYAQGMANIPSGVGNLAKWAASKFTGKEPEYYKQFDFAPHNLAATTGNIGSFLSGPGLLGLLGKASGIAKGVNSIPAIANAMSKGSKIMGKYPISSNIGKNALLGGMYSDPGEEGKGMLVGGATSALMPFLTKNINPLSLLGTGVGAGIGGAIGGLEGHPIEGALMGALGGKKYSTRGKPGRETIKNLNEQEVIPAVEAAQRLGTTITPSEASGNPYIGGIEGRYRRSGEAAQVATDIGKERIKSQKNAINNLLNAIYDKSELSNNKIRGLYKQSYMYNIKDISNLKNDPIIDEAYKTVKKSKAFQKKLANIDESNYAYLDAVKRAIADKESLLIKKGKKEEASIYTSTRNELTDFLDKNNPYYKKARMEAQKSIVRSQIEKNIKKQKEITGANFYNNIIGNDIKFEKLMQDLKNNPEAQQIIEDMKSAWVNLSNLQKPGAAAFQSEKNISAFRESISHLVNSFNELMGSKRNVKAVEFINSDKWIKELSKIKNEKDRKNYIINFIGKLTPASAVSLSNNKNGEE